MNGHWNGDVEVFKSAQNYESKLHSIAYQNMGYKSINPKSIHILRPSRTGGIAVAAMFTAASTLTAGALSYTKGDLFLSFRVGEGEGAPLNYVVNIGQASQYRNAVAPGPVNIVGLGNIAADLSVIYGPDWHSRDVYWSISGTPGPSAVGGDPLRTLYASRRRANPVIPSEPWLRAHTNAQALPTNKLTSFAGAYIQKAGLATGSTQNSSVALIQVASDQNSYSSFQTGVTSFSYFNPSIEGVLTDGTSSSVLDLWRILPATGSQIGSPGELVGSFKLDNSGTLTFIKGVFSVPSSQISRSGSNVTASIGGYPGSAYLVQRSTDLQLWAPLSTVTANSSGLVQFTDTSPPPGRAFYRTFIPFIP